MSLGKGEDTKAFREVFFGPGCEFRLVLLPLFDEGPQPLFGVLTGVGVEDGFDLAGNEALEFVFGDVVLCVLLKMKLATLPGACVERCFEGCLESAMGIGGDEARNAHAAFFEASEEVAPMHFSLGQSAADSEDHAFTIAEADAMGDEGGAVSDRAVDTDFVVGGVEGHVSDLGQWAGAPFFKFFVELFIELGDLAGRDFEAAHRFHDFGDTPGADAFDIHSCDGRLEGAVAARAFFKKSGSEGFGAVTNLWYGEFQGSDASLKGARFKAVAITVALDTPLVWRGSNMAFPLQEHGCIDKGFGNIFQAVFEPVLKKEVDELVLGIILNLFVHGFV